MKILSSLLYLCPGAAACLALETAALSAGGGFDRGNGPYLVVAPPWGGGAAEVVRQAGGVIVGPTQAPLSVLADGADAAALAAAGAWWVLDPTVLGISCGSGEV
ncbi:hypothetical protein SAMN05878503_10582 [Cereibacter ovatus]|uniref:Uncharacterized protein n=1 Tax=Cereibacter ovatus TaxID=439529 RepID=A0A285CT86_9RHOB|nr:hypothetical protein [Cereibacter ovatus]SNX70173.1 hypothetical protein SAMN05878503_10582 [Cereibacter ovatus]